MFMDIRIKVTFTLISTFLEYVLKTTFKPLVSNCVYLLVETTKRNKRKLAE